MAQVIAAAGQRAFIDVFGQDLQVSLGAPISVYAQPYELGVVIAQTDRPDLVLEFLGRR